MSHAPHIRRVGVFWISAAILAALGCRDDRADRFGGPIDPCSVPISSGAPMDHQVTWRPAGRDAARRGHWWEMGPHYIWTTSPSRKCEDDPETGAETVSPERRVYITYPASKRPTHDGEGQAAPGPFPVIVFAHANHDRVCRIYDGYYSLHDHWASWGFVVASVDSTVRNCQPGTNQNIVDRADDQVAALQLLHKMHDDPDSILSGRLDLDRVLLAGHSRGGGATLINATQRADLVPGLRGVIDLQGVDTTSYGFGTPDVTVPAIGLSAGNDVDLNFPYVEYTEEQLKAPYTWVTIFGGVHAWTGDGAPLEPDDGPEITRAQQHDLTEFYTTAFLANTVGVVRGEQESAAPALAAKEVLFGHEGARAARAHELSRAGSAARWRRWDDEAILIDDFNDLDRRHTNLTGGATEFVGFHRAMPTFTYAPNRAPEGGAIEKSRALFLETRTMQGLAVFEVARDAPIPSSYLLEARVRGWEERRMPEFHVIVVEADGTRHFFEGKRHIGPEPISDRFTQLSVPLAQLDEFEDLEIAQVRILVEDGTLILDDLRLTPPRE